MGDEDRTFYDSILIATHKLFSDISTISPFNDIGRRTRSKMSISLSPSFIDAMNRIKGTHESKEPLNPEDIRAKALVEDLFSEPDVPGIEADVTDILGDADSTNDDDEPITPGTV